MWNVSFFDMQILEMGVLVARTKSTGHGICANPSYGICGTYTLHLAMLSWLKLAQDDADLLIWAIS